MDTVVDEKPEEEYFNHIMNDIEEFFRSNKLNKKDFIQMKTFILLEQAGSKKEGEMGISKDEKINSINLLIKYHEENGNFNVRSQVSHQATFDLDEIRLCELKLSEVFTKGKFDINFKKTVSKLLQQSGMLTKMSAPFNELKDYQHLMEETKRLEEDGKNGELDDDPELKIEINNAKRNKATSMFKVKEHLLTIREVIMESSLFNLRFGGNIDYLEECELDFDLIKNRQIVAGTLQVIDHNFNEKDGKI